MIFSCNRCVACVKFDALFGKGIDALCEARCRLERPNYGVYLDAGEIFLVEVKSTLENAARNIHTTLGTGVISRLKVRKIFTGGSTSDYLRSTAAPKPWRKRATESK